MNGKPLVLVILDGFGCNQNESYNAIKNAATPNWDSIWAQYPKTTILTSGSAVGLPEGQMGNSEVGHLTLGAGRLIFQNLTRINKAIADGSFNNNKAYCHAIDSAIATNKNIHILGLLSAGGVHSHEDHINAAIELAVARGASKVFLHAFLDGRDCPPGEAIRSLARTQDLFDRLGHGKIASVIGRFYAMDRDQNWDRILHAYKLITEADAPYEADNPISALEAAYARNETDEFVSATKILGKDQCVTKIEDGDSVIFMNFRPDRARQLSHALIGKQSFMGFDRPVQRDLSSFVTTTQYETSLSSHCAFPPQTINNSIGTYLADIGKRQLRIAETEKYAHVTFFFNGGEEAPLDGEERILLPSPNVATYDLQPQMSAPEVTEKLVRAIKSECFDVIICNYANCDMVGHTGNFQASIQAVEAIDNALGQVLKALSCVGGEALFTADHGNVEQMFDDINHQPHTQHTTFPVPFVYVGASKLTLRKGGTLADVAPTMLQLLGLPKPKEMTGTSLIE
jgi:2,3-bisphosphoglycerate-independent phosphoglycerate mutase